MAERRLSSKYAPPGNFDPWEIIRQRQRQPNNQPIRVRIHLPMSLRCLTCRNILYKGARVNSRKECCSGEMCSGTQIFRFSFKCSSLLKGNGCSCCSAKITLKTDPQNSDYTVESGATREVEPWCEENEINGSSEVVLNPTDMLTKFDGHESAKKEAMQSLLTYGNKHSTLSTTVNPCKKQKTEPTAGLDDCEKPVAEESNITTIK